MSARLMSATGGPKLPTSCPRKASKPTADSRSLAAARPAIEAEGGGCSGCLGQRGRLAEETRQHMHEPQPGRREHPGNRLRDCLVVDTSFGRLLELNAARSQ